MKLRRIFKVTTNEIQIPLSIISLTVIIRYNYLAIDFIKPSKLLLISYGGFNVYIQNMAEFHEKKARNARRLREENVIATLKWFNVGPNNNITGYCRTGEVFAFLGTTDVKSGIMKELACANSNKVLLNDVPLTPDDVTFIDVQCSDILYNNLTVLETIAYSAELRVCEKTHASELTALRLLKEMGLKDIADKKIREISLWQRRMIVLATEVAAEYGVIFFDLPTSDLDASSAVSMIRAMQNIVRSGDNKTNILMITINSFTFREYVRLDRVQLILRYTGVDYSTDEPSPGALHSMKENDAESIYQSSHGASSIYFGAGSSALTYFVSRGRVPTPGASISDFLMDLVDTIRHSELIALEEEYMKSLKHDTVLFPLDKQQQLEQQQRQRHGSIDDQDVLDSEYYEHRNINRNIMPFTPMKSTAIQRSMEYSSYSNFSNGRSESVGGTTRYTGWTVEDSEGPSPIYSYQRSPLQVEEDRSRSAMTSLWSTCKSCSRIIKYKLLNFSVDTCIIDITYLATTVLGCVYDKDNDEFTMPTLMKEFIWCLWRACIVRCRDVKNVLSIWCISGVMVAIGLLLCYAGTLTYSIGGIYHRIILLSFTPFLNILVGCMWNLDDCKDRAVFSYERVRGYYGFLMFFPLCTIIADILVYRLIPPLIITLLMYPMVGLSLDASKMYIFCKLVMLLCIAGSCLCKAILNLFSVIRYLNSSKISMLTAIIITMLLLIAIGQRFHPYNDVTNIVVNSMHPSSVDMSGVEVTERVLYPQMELSLHLNSTSIPNMVPTVTVKDLSLFYEVSYCCVYI